MVWIEKQTNRSISLSQSLIQSNVLIPVNSLKAESGEEAAEDKYAGSSAWFVRFKERSHLHNIRVQTEGASPDAEIILI